MSIARRRSTRMLAAAGLAVVALGGVVAGCGGDDDGASAGEPAAETQETMEETTEATEDTTEAHNSATASLESATVSAEFTVLGCDNTGETDLVLKAERDAYTLDVDAPNGRGTLIYRSGNEEDGVDASGVVTSVAVGDAGDFTVEGTWNDDGQPFTLTGSCAG